MVFAQTFRRIRPKKETLRPDSGEKVKVYLGIHVIDLEFHPFSNRLRVKGLIKEGPLDLVTLDSHHTLNIEVNSQFRIRKERWLKIHLKRIEEAVAEGEMQPILITVVDEREATIALVTNLGIKIITHIQENIPGKRFKIAYHDQSLQKFYHEIGRVLMENCRIIPVRGIVLAGPGFSKEHLKKYLTQKVSEITVPVIIENASSANKNGIFEVIKRGAISKILGGLRIRKESELIEEVLRRLGKNHRNVSYGFTEIKKIATTNAIDTLLITDVFLREQPLETRKEIDEIIRNVEYNQGKVYIISTLHPAGEQLRALGGIAALLRFNIFDG